MQKRFTFNFGAFLLATMSTTFASVAQVLPTASPQGWDTLPWKSYADYRMQPLNKSYINTGILYDRMLPIPRVDVY